MVKRVTLKHNDEPEEEILRDDANIFTYPGDCEGHSGDVCGFDLANQRMGTCGFGPQREVRSRVARDTPANVRWIAIAAVRYRC